MRFIFIIFCSIFFFFIYIPSSSAKSLTIVTSIAPLQSILLNLIDEGDHVDLLIPYQQSPHHFFLKPSHTSLLQKADVFFYIDEDFEQSLAKIISSDLLHDLKKIPLAKITSISLLKRRKSDLLIVNEHDHEHGNHSSHGKESQIDTPKEEDHHNHDTLYDYHFWLDPKIIMHLATPITQTLIALNPDKRTQYEQRNIQFIHALEVLHKKIQLSFSETLKTSHILVHHDAYQYFEKAFQLPMPLMLYFDPHRPLSGNRLKKIRQQIQKYNTRCIFYEPQFSMKTMQTLQKEFELELIQLDPLGSQFTLDKNLYFSLLETLEKFFSKCK